MSTTIHPNVNSDQASKFDFINSLEGPYLKGVLQHLKELMGTSFDEFHFYVFSGIGERLLPASINDIREKKVLIYLSDESASFPLHLQNNYVAIFKCYLPYEKEGIAIYPFPLGFVGDVPFLPVKPVSQRNISVFFSGCLNLNRLRLYRELTSFKYLPFFLLYLLKRVPWLDKNVVLHLPQDLSNTFEQSSIRFTHYFRQKNFSGESYSQMLNDSKIVLCPKGFHSSETFRHYEAMRQGAVLFSERLPDTSLYQGCPAIQIKNWKEGLRKIKLLIDNPSQLDTLSKSSIDFWEQKWSEQATAKFMFSKLSKVNY